MAKSLKNRLNGNTPEFLKDVETYGIWHAMERYGVKDYISALHLLESETGNPNFGFNPKLATSPGRDLGSQIVDVLEALKNG